MSLIDGMRSMLRERGKVRTNLWCHDCRNNFSVALDYDLDGNHVIECPHCGHEHCRVIRDGVVTGDRWDSRNGLAQSYSVSNTPQFMWLSSATTTTATNSTSHFTSALWARTGTAQ